jgi:hypothetical protein
MPQYFTYRKDVNLGPGETLGFQSGKGYYAKPAPVAAKPPTAAQAAAAGARVGAATNQYYADKGYEVGGLNHVYDTQPQVTVDPVTGLPVSSKSGAAAPDWSSYLGMYGLPADVQKELNAIFARTPDITQATQLAVAYVRGTPWYAQTYPGIQEAIAKGVIRDERDYRSRQNDFNQIYRQYAQRDITGEEYAQHLREGVTTDVVGRRFQGAALESAYGNDWQYAEGAFGEGRLNAEESKAYGQQAAGLDSPLGMRVQRRLQLAQERLKAVFSGQSAVGQLSLLNQPGKSPADIGR